MDLHAAPSQLRQAMLRGLRISAEGIGQLILERCKLDRSNPREAI